MWIAIHMGRNREHIGSKETVKSLYIARDETGIWMVNPTENRGEPVFS
jgi:hypothetical protein